MEIAYAAIDHAFGRNPTGRHFNFDYDRPELITVTARHSSGHPHRIQLVETSPLAREHRGVITAEPGETIRATYGYGYYTHTAEHTVE